MTLTIIKAKGCFVSDSTFVNTDVTGPFILEFLRLDGPFLSLRPFLSPVLGFGSLRIDLDDGPAQDTLKKSLGLPAAPNVILILQSDVSCSSSVGDRR